MSIQVPDAPFQLTAADLEKYVFDGGVNFIFLLMLNTGSTDIWAANPNRSADLVAYDLAPKFSIKRNILVPNIGFVTRGVARVKDLQLSLYEGSSLIPYGYIADENTKKLMVDTLGPMVPNGSKVVWERQH